MQRSLLFALLLAGCSAPPPAPEPTVTPSAVASATPTAAPTPSNNVVETGKAVFRTMKGRPWLLEAFKVKYSEGQQEARLENVDWTLSDAKGNKLIRIKSNGAVYKLDSERVVFDGAVEARRYQSKDLLRANRMVWDGKTGILKGMDGVRWTRGRTTVVGDTATTNDRLERITVEGNVRMTTVLEGDPFDTGG